MNGNYNIHQISKHFQTASYIQIPGGQCVCVCVCVFSLQINKLNTHVALRLSQMQVNKTLIKVSMRSKYD